MRAGIYLWYIYYDSVENILPKFKRTVFLSSALQDLSHDALYDTQRKGASVSAFINPSIPKSYILGQLSLLLLPTWSFYALYFRRKMAAIDRQRQGWSYNGFVLTF